MPIIFSAQSLPQRISEWGDPEYMLGHLDRIAVIEKRLAAHPGLFVAGNAYRDIGIPDCIVSGGAEAETAMKSLIARSRRTAALREQDLS